MKEQNYPEVFEHYRKEFLKIDQEETAGRLGLTITGRDIEVPWFNERVRIDRQSGEITTPEGFDVNVKEKLLIMHHLCFSKAEAQHSGKWCTIRELKEASLLEQSCQKQAARPVEAAFSGKLDAFRQACEKLGGKPESKGDAAYIIPVLPAISLKYVFYDADEEFPAACTILFESTIEDWTHPEDVSVLAAIATERLIRCLKQDSQEDVIEKKVKITILYVSETEKTATVAQYIEQGMVTVSPEIEIRRMDMTDRSTYDIRFLQESDAVVFGSPVYFGNMQWKMKQWFDTSIRIKLDGKLGGAFATEQSVSGGAEMAVLTMLQHMLVKNMLVYAPKSVHFGPVAVGSALESYEKAFSLYGKQFAQKAVELFGRS
ncbi:DUF3786 domain-containing protein [Eubacterium sp. 1001713B170207_170306_E7]|uniref:DUF3786 domain-containing protein n=1 Tax=Eubacterium sp. 1001713B170207_170306_E7 TaxID=2787097 RepID=UPI001899D79F|nr:DUF3786 domain-containing protein [Eubacterium sp. 1001713B170207_170306_E7]